VLLHQDVELRDGDLAERLRTCMRDPLVAVVFYCLLPLIVLKLPRLPQRLALLRWTPLSTGSLGLGA
jgi:hypothetical protein